MDLFLDTNIYLAFYSFSSDDLEEVRKLTVAVNSGQTTLYLTDQVRDEFNRNRDSKIAESLKTIAAAKLQKSFPRLFDSFPGYERLRTALQAYEEELRSLLDEVRKHAVAGTLHADQLIGDLFNLATMVPVTAAILDAARRRSDVGNPPGKPGSLGDQINWEALLAAVPAGRALFVVTGDVDFRSKLDPTQVSTFLRNEWHTAKGSTVTVYENLTALFAAHYPHIQLAAELEKELAINRLISSENFLKTHSALLNVSQYADFSPEQAEALIEAANRNTQIRWILGDDDVGSFFTTLATDYQDVLDPNELATFWANYNFANR